MYLLEDKPSVNDENLCVKITFRWCVILSKLQSVLAQSQQGEVSAGYNLDLNIYISGDIRNLWADHKD